MPYCPECSASVPEGTSDCPTCGAQLVATPTGAEEPDGGPRFDTGALEKELGESLHPRYEILKLLGVGGMGAVFLAREPALKRLVAVKVLAPFLAADAKARARFEREATAAAALSHPNVVRVYSVGETAGRRLPYIVMQYVQGETLAAWMTGREKVGERDARRVIGEVASALAAAHRRDVVHRDVKPSNVLLEGESGRAFVADFGVSAALSPDQRLDQTKLTATGMLIGTPVYMSPEQAAGEEVSPKSDIYSLGMLAYELVTGELPFQATSALGWVAAHMRDTPTPVQRKRPDLAPEVLRLIDRMLAKEPAGRPTAEEISRGMLPSLETEIEWPPPGLKDLRSHTRTLLQALNFTAFGALLLVAMIAFTPHILRVHEHWLARFNVAEQVDGVAVRSRGAVETGEVSYFAWQLGMMLGAASLGLGLVLSAALGQRFARRLRHGRRLGWRWSTLLDAAADPDAGSGLILAGAREFASIADADRQAILRARRLRTAFLFGALAWATLATALWLAAVMAGFGRSHAPAPAAGTGALLFVLAPSLALGIAAAAHARRERWLLGPLSRPRRSDTTTGEVADWYGTAPGGLAAEPAGDPPVARRWLRRAGVAAAGVAMIVIALWAGAALLASLTAARFVQRMGPSAATLARALDRVARERPYDDARTAWARLLPATTALHADTARTLVRAEGMPRYDPGHVRLFFNDTSMATAVERAVRGALPADTIGLLGDLGRHPRTLAVRRLALADSIDVWAATLDRPIESYGSAWFIPVADMRGLRDAVHANALSALGALARGDRRAFEARLGENASFAEKLLHEPILLYNLQALRMLQRDVLGVLRGIALAEGRAQDAAMLEEARDRLDQARLATVRGMGGLAADPTHLDEYERWLSDDGLLSGIKAELLVSGWAGVCASPREILGGPSKARRQAMRELAERSGMRHARETALLIDRTWTTPIGAFASRGEFRDYGWLERSPLVVLLRLSMCSDPW